MGPRLNRPFTVVGVGTQHGIVELPPVLADRQNAAMRLDEVLAEPLEAWPSHPPPLAFLLSQNLTPAASV